MSIEVMKQALEFIEETNKSSSFWMVPASKLNQTAKALRQAIAVYESAPPECQTEAEKTAFAFGWWKAMEIKEKNT